MIDHFKSNRTIKRLPRILFVLKYREQPYGGSYTSDWTYSKSGKPLCSGLSNSAGMAMDMLVDMGYVADMVHVADGNDIHRECVKFKADICIVEAFWCPPYKFGDLLAALPNTKFIVRNHSKTPFLSSEGVAFGWTFEYVKYPNVLIAPNSIEMLGDTLAMGIPAIKLLYLPNYYSHDRLRPRDNTWKKRGDLNVGCFGAVRPLKNVIEQAIASIGFARKNNVSLKFHINGNRVEGNGDPILKNLRNIFKEVDNAELVEHDWMDSSDFRHLIRSMDVVLQVSLSETFNIVLADAAYAGVPTVGSKEIPWIPECTSADPTSRRDIEKKMKRALGVWSKVLVKGTQKNIMSYNSKSATQWNKVLMNI